MHTIPHPHLATAEPQLAAVAAAQASRIAEGWQIEQVEASVGPEQNARIVVVAVAIEQAVHAPDVRFVTELPRSGAGIGAWLTAQQDIAGLQADDLGDARAGRIEELEQGPISAICAAVYMAASRQACWIAR